ncbi:helicase associated domain-containing protein [Streptomyces sp. NPDC056638]|uniref:helicase associated domain-containing protein n=1 Tax=Streptomyces sp. NPDC056638 TaxID=3345887 RepID=UPI0036CCE938
MHQQRRAYRAGELEDHRKKQLGAEGMVWEPGDEAWETKLAALRPYHRAHSHLAPRQEAVWGEEDNDLVPIGQLIANLRRKGSLGKNAERAQARAKQLATIDEEWCCPWPLDWQRHYRILADLVDADGVLPAIEPGVLFEADGLGRWLKRQANSWAQLTTEQQGRLTALGVKSTERPAPAAKAAAKGAGKASAAFQRGVAALAQCIAREGGTRHRPVAHRADHHRRPTARREAQHLGLQHQPATGQAHRLAARRPRRTRSRVGVAAAAGR